METKFWVRFSGIKLYMLISFSLTVFEILEILLNYCVSKFGSMVSDIALQSGTTWNSIIPHETNLMFQKKAMPLSS